MDIKNTSTPVKVILASAVVAASWGAGSWASAADNDAKPAQLSKAPTAAKAKALWVYKKKNFDVDANDYNAGYVDCPKNYHVTGGGIQTSDIEILLNETRPYDNPGGDNKPDNGWQGYVINPTDNDGSFTIYAICHR